MAALFARKRRVFTRDTERTDWHPFGRDLAAYPLLTSKELEIEHHTNRERYLRGDSLPAFAEAEHDVFQNLKGEAYRRLDAKVASALKARFRVRIDPSLEEPTYEPAEKVLKQAADLHRDRKPDRALFLYGKLREKFPERAALQYAVGLGMAQIHLEQKRYQQALAEYRRAQLSVPREPRRLQGLVHGGFHPGRAFQKRLGGRARLRENAGKTPRQRALEGGGLDDPQYPQRRRLDSGALM